MSMHYVSTVTPLPVSYFWYVSSGKRSSRVPCPLLPVVMHERLVVYVLNMYSRKSINVLENFHVDFLVEDWEGRVP